MPDLFDDAYIIYGFAALAGILIVEALYLLLAGGSETRGRINRRLKIMEEHVDQRSTMAQLRRERGLSISGGYTLPIAWLNRLVLQSGLTIGMGKLTLMAMIAAVAIFVVLLMAADRQPLEAVAGALAGGVLLPIIVLRWLRKRRQSQFGGQFPEAIDIIVRSLRAGHPVPVAVSMVAREMADPVGSEFGLVVDEVTYGSDMDSAMRNLLFRVGQADLALFVTAVSIQSSSGGNLREILQNLSAVIRMRLKMRRKIKALTAEGRFSALLLSALPILLFLVIQSISPSFYGEVWNDTATHIGLGAAGGWMLFGNVLMYKMINFRI